MRYRGWLQVAMVGMIVVVALASGAQEAAAPPPPAVHTVVGEENLVRAVLLLDGLPQCDGLAARVVENAVGAGRIGVQLDLVGPGDCPPSEGSLRVELTGVPAGEYAVDVVIRDARGPHAEEVLVSIDAVHIAVPGGPQPDAKWTLTVDREGRLENWVEVPLDSAPSGGPDTPSAPELVGPGQPGAVRFQ